MACSSPPGPPRMATSQSRSPGQPGSPPANISQESQPLPGGPGATQSPVPPNTQHRAAFVPPLSKPRPLSGPSPDPCLDAGPPTSDLPTRRASTASLPKSPLAPQPKSFGGSHYRMVLVRPDDLAHLSHLTPGLISLKPSPQLQAGHAPQRWSRLPSAPIPSSCCSLARRAIDRPRPVLVTRGQQRNASKR